MIAVAFGASQSIHSICGDRLAGVWIRAHRGPVTFRFDFFVGNGAFEHEHERFEPAFGRQRASIS